MQSYANFKYLKMNACIELYKIVNPAPVGTKKGTCRITGERSTGVSFAVWVKDTFTNFDCLKPGEIISNEALFCFDEASQLLQAKRAGISRSGSGLTHIS